MWEKVRLKEICTLFDDGDWIETKHQSESGIRLIQTGNVKTGSFSDRIDKARYISEETFASLKCTEIFCEDILVSRLPQPVGRACIIPPLYERAITAVDCTIIRVQKERVIPEFLNYFMQSPSYFSSVQSEVTGATRQRISRKKLGEIPINLPPLAEQQRIVAKLEDYFAEIDIMISNTNESKSNLKLIMSRYLNYIFSIKNNYFSGTIKDCCSIISGTTVNKNLEKDSGDLPYLKVADMNIKGNELKITTSTRFLDSKSIKKRNIIKKGSIIFPKRGGAIATNKKRITDTEIAVDLNIMTVMPKEALNPKLLYYYFLSIDLGRLGSGSSIPQINNYDIEPLEINFPNDTREQKILVSKLDVFYNNIKKLEEIYINKVHNLFALKSIILEAEIQD